MRILCFLAMSAMSAGAAQASSFLVLAPMKENVGPSIVVLGSPQPVAAISPFAPVPVAETPLSYPYPEEMPEVVLAPAEPEPVVISNSVIAMGSPAVSLDKVAAIRTTSPKISQPPFAMPVVIRGGIVGDAFPSSAGVPIAPAPSESNAASKGAGGGSSGPAAPSEPKAPAQPPAAVAPAGPVRAPE